MLGWAWEPPAGCLSWLPPAAVMSEAVRGDLLIGDERGL